MDAILFRPQCVKLTWTSDTLTPVSVDIHHQARMGWKASQSLSEHDDVIKWKHFPRYWPLICDAGIHHQAQMGWKATQSPSEHDDVIKWKHFPRYCPWFVTRSLMFSLISAWTKGWVNNRDAGDLRRHCAHYDFNVMSWYYGLATYYGTFHR